VGEGAKVLSPTLSPWERAKKAKERGRRTVKNSKLKIQN
jgi:hypothetical protein